MLYEPGTFFSDLKLDRAFMILRRGGFVILRDERGQAALMRAAEFADTTLIRCAPGAEQRSSMFDRPPP